MFKQKLKLIPIIALAFVCLSFPVTVSMKSIETVKTVEAEVLSTVGNSSNSVPNFTLENQFGAATSVKFPSDKAVVLVFGDREGSEQVEGWVRPLYGRFTDQIYIFGIAELSAVPKMVRPVVRRIIKGKSKYPIMLDWNGSVSKSYGCEKGKANVFVINKAGKLVGVKRGAANSAALNEVFQSVGGAL